MRFLAYTGLRRGEAAALHTRRVDLTRRRVEIIESVTEVRGALVSGRTKTHARRVVPLPRVLALGHQTATMTLDLYGHLFPDRLDELADRFDDAPSAPDVPPGPGDDAEEGTGE